MEVRRINEAEVGAYNHGACVNINGRRVTFVQQLHSSI